MQKLCIVYVYMCIKNINEKDKCNRTLYNKIRNYQISLNTNKYN